MLLVGVCALAFGCANESQQGAANNENGLVDITLSDTMPVITAPEIPDGEPTFADSSLIIVDDKKVSAEEFKAIDIKNVASFTIMRDDSSKKSYGAEDKAAVILMKTKKDKQ